MAIGLTMSSNESPSPSDDGDVLVTDLLQRLSPPDNNSEVEPTQIRRALEATDIEPASYGIGFAVEVPIVDNVGEYRSLPGHSVVRRILGKESTLKGDFYKVELESSDKELVSGINRNLSQTLGVLPDVHLLTAYPDLIPSTPHINERT